jgi:hypothetical protein
MSGAITLLSLYAFMAWTGATLPFTFPSRNYARALVTHANTNSVRHNFPLRPQTGIFSYFYEYNQIQVREI